MRNSYWSSDVCSFDLPFNIDSKTKEYIKANYCGMPLIPEVWFQKALELFGTSVPIAMFTHYGFRLNQTDNSSRWKKFIEGEYPAITSIVSLPKDVFDVILFHSEVLIFNLSALNDHYFLQHRSEEHTSELQSLMSNSYAVFCLKKT